LLWRAPLTPALTTPRAPRPPPRAGVAGGGASATPAAHVRVAGRAPRRGRERVAAVRHDDVRKYYNERSRCDVRPRAARARGGAAAGGVQGAGVQPAVRAEARAVRDPRCSRSARRRAPPHAPASRRARA
jgi:hypothetical protein